METIRWVLIDESDGAKAGDGSSLTPNIMQAIAGACSEQLNGEFSAYYGGSYSVRAAENANDIQPGEYVYIFKPTLPVQGASAYHDTTGTGVPVSFCAVTTCTNMTGKGGVSVDATHELIEASADPGCNTMCDDGHGHLIAYEPGDPVEVQSYSHDPGGVQVSNFVLPSWFNPKGIAPFDYMSSANLDGAVAPPGPFQIAPSPDGNGNYEIIETSGDAYDVFGIKGNPRKDRSHPNTRLMRRAAIRQESNAKLHMFVVGPHSRAIPAARQFKTPPLAPVKINTQPTTRHPAEPRPKRLPVPGVVRPPVHRKSRVGRSAVTSNPAGVRTRLNKK